MADRLDEALDFAAQTLGIQLKIQQTTALRQLVQGHDLFVNLPTGFGKSIIFQAATIVLDFLNEKRSRELGGEEFNKALVIVVLPLKALVVDQLDRIKKIGLDAADITTEVTDEILEHSQEYSIIFASPETLCGARGKEFLKAVKSRCFALFVDESHCVSKWGHSSGQSAAFRKCYSQLGELRSILNKSTTIVALTATATKNVRQTVVDSLAMRNYGLIEESPERNNIKYVVEKVTSKNWDEVFEWLCKEVKVKQRLTPRIIVYCQSRKQVSEMYAIFCSMLPHDCHRYFNMYHTNTEDGVQRAIIESFSKDDGEVRVLFATIAFGLGIDVCGVHTVILVGHPTDLDDLMQLSGRAGRDGSQSVAVLIEYPGAGSGLKTSDEMKEFIRGEGCRREVIRQSFPSSSKSSNVPIWKHNCCDVCAKTCVCDGQICSVVPSYAEQQLHDIALHGPNSAEHQVVTVSDTEVITLTEKLQQFRETLLSDTSCHMYTGGDMACGLSLNTIKDIAAQCNVIFTYDQFCEKYAFGTKKISLEVWNMLQTTLNRQSEPLSVMGYLSDDSDESVEDSENDLLSGEYAEIVLDADSGDSN